jgi:hypothetical protein
MKIKFNLTAIAAHWERVVGSVSKASSPPEVSASARPTEQRPLQREPPPPAQFPVEALGPILGDAALAIEDAIQAPLAICGNSVLAAAHLAVQAHADVEIDGRVHPLSEFFVTVGESGERKSAVDTVALQEHREYEKCLHDSALAERAAALDCADELPLPLDPIVLCEEPTFPALVKNLATAQPSQGLFSDEGGRFLSSHAMNAENALSTIAGLSKLWDGKAIDRVRVADGATKLYGKRLSCHLMGQPQVMAGLIADPEAQAQGFLSRCLIVIPESRIGQRPYRGIRLSESGEMARYHARMRELLDRDPIVEDPNDPIRRSQLRPRRLVISDDAKRIYVDFHDAVERAMAGKFKELRAFANKAPEHLLRIAGTLALVEDPEATEVREEHARSARILVDYFLHEAHRMNEIARQDPALTLAQRLLDWIRQLDRPVSLVEIYQRGPNALRNARRARDTVRILLEHGHLEPVRGIVYDGRRRSEGWRLRR